MFRTILCPIDFTTFSHQALEYAAALARAEGASLTGIHVVPTHGAGNTTGDDLSRLQAQVLKMLREVDAPSPTAVAVLGDPATEIEQLASTMSADLIVMPLHGWTGFSSHCCGSVTEHVLCHVAAPVMVVPDTSLLVPHDGFRTESSSRVVRYDPNLCHERVVPNLSCRTLRAEPVVPNPSCRTCRAEPIVLPH